LNLLKSGQKNMEKYLMIGDSNEKLEDSVKIEEVKE